MGREVAPDQAQVMYHNEFINDVTYCLEANSCPIFNEYSCDVETGASHFHLSQLCVMGIYLYLCYI